jgi:flagellar biosynthesis protein
MKHPDLDKQENQHQSTGPLSTEKQTYTPSAVALTYHDGMTAPQVVAKGQGVIAEEIIRRAKEADVYVHESAELVALLMKVDLDEHIPPELYIAVAELLAWLYRLENGTTTPSA